MTEYRHEIRALIDPEQTEGLIDGSPLQHVSVILTDDPSPDPGDPARRPPAAVTLRPRDARELAFELLTLAEHAEQMRPRR
jgi:hypothetical protein